MIKKHFFCVALFLCSFLLVAQDVPSSEVQIKTAILASPEKLGDDATIYGYNRSGNWKLLRKGTNAIICLADDPGTDGFSASCYHESLEPFMARGRALKAKEMTHQEIFEIREDEVKRGKLKMPKDGTTLFVFYAEQGNYDSLTGKVQNGTFRYVVYIPYATVETTGLPLSPSAPGMPWIMDPGTHRAHIMITPPPAQ